MDSERLKQIEEIYHAVIDLPSEDQKSFIDKCCGDDEDLRREVESLLDFDGPADNFIDASPESLAAEMFTGTEDRGRLIDEKIGHYHIISKIGEGGMGEVYLAEDAKLARKVALKLLPEAFIGDQYRMERFVREAKSVSALNHPNIITIYEIGESNGVHFIATEYIAGKTLNEYAHRRPLKYRTVLKIAIQVASALDEAHSAGIVHRDIKPENIMIRPDGLLKVLDFGIAKLSDRENTNLDANKSIKTDGTRPGIIIGTADYMSPEQARGGMIDARSDIFSLGIVLYEILCGKKPFDGENAVDTIGAILHKEPIPLGDHILNLPPAIGHIIDKSLQKNVSDRYQNIKNVLIDLRNAKNRLDYNELESSLTPEFRIESRTAPATNRAKQEQKTQLFEASDSAQIDSLQNTPPHNLTYAEGEKLNLEVGNAPAREGEPQLPPNPERETHITDQERSYTQKYSTSDEIGAAVFSGVETTDPQVPGPNNFLSRLRQMRIFPAASIIVFLIAVGFLGLQYLNANSQIRSIAVIPFANETAVEENELLSDGLSESLIGKLSQLPQVKVIARSSSFKYKGRELDVAEIGESLGVQAVITGRISKVGDNLQISVEMINAADKTRIWGETYIRKASGTLDVPEEIAQDISKNLHLTLSVDQKRQMEKNSTVNAQAYQLNLTGVFYQRQNGADNLKKAVEYQNEAIALDPNFAQAYAEAALNYAALVEIGALDPSIGKPKSRDAAEKAVALDRALPVAYFALGYIENQDLNFASARQNFEKAIELNQNFAGAHTLYAAYLSQFGQTEEALSEIKRAQELDPLRAGLIGNEGIIYYYARRYGEAISKMQEGLRPEPENAPARVLLGQVYSADGQYAKAIREFETALQTDPESTSTSIYLGSAFALSGDREKAVAILNELQTSKQYVSPAVFAILYASLGDIEPAFKSLEKAYAERDNQLQVLKVEPGYDPLRKDPRFADLLRRMGLPE